MTVDHSVRRSVLFTLGIACPVCETIDPLRIRALTQQAAPYVITVSPSLHIDTTESVLPERPVRLPAV